jgi:hypothetical protein
MATQTFILELTKKQCQLIGQLLHIHLDDKGEHPIGESLLIEMVAQTNCVEKDADQHLVGMGIESLRGDVKQSHSAWYVPYDDGTKIHG